MIAAHAATSRASVVIVGAGAAGAVAAAAAARAGADTLLIERHGFLGGTSTAVLDTFYGFYTPGASPRRVVGGIAAEVVERLRSLGKVVERPNSFGAGTGVTYHPEHLKVVWDRLVTESRAHVLVHALLVDGEVEDGRVRAILVATKAGLMRVEGDVFVDASGDADLCYHAGFSYEAAGTVAPAQTLTTTFKLCNVDVERRRALSKRDVTELMRAAAAEGSYDLPRIDGSDHITPIEGVTATIMTRIPAVRSADGAVVGVVDDPAFLTEVEMEGRRQALEYVRFLRDRVPGYERAELITLSTQIGVRETRRVHGDYRLTREDVLSAAQFDDQVALCGAPIEDHHDAADTRWQYLPEGEAVGIPLRTLVVRDADNVLVAGRCFSATHDAHASVRSMAQCMAMGHAAGVAAALAARSSGAVRDVGTQALRNRLAEEGAVLHVATGAGAAA